MGQLPYLVAIFIARIAGAIGVEAEIRGGETKVAVVRLDSEALWGGGVMTTRVVAHGEASVVRTR